MMTWIDIPEERYWEQLGVLPPERWKGGWFLMGEPMGGEWPEYTFFAYRWLPDDRFQTASRAITIKEFELELKKEARS